MKPMSLVFAICLLAAVPASAVWVEVEPGAEPLSVEVLEPDAGRTVLQFEVGRFKRNPVQIDGDILDVIRLGSESAILEQGHPDLPNVCRSVLLPETGAVAIRVLESSFRDIPGIRVAPSKGNLSRSVNPADVPYTFAAVYDEDEWYPANVVTHREPHIIRDFRGVTVVVNPFQYNARTRTLRVTTHLKIEVVTTAAAGVNELQRHRPLEAVNQDFHQIYREHFLNYERSRYTPLDEQNRMLVICYDSWVANLEPFVDWKNQMGVLTELVTRTQAGTSATGIKNFVQAYYDSTHFAYLLLVGDYTEMPTLSAAGGASDPSYSLLDGTDDYPEIFVGRFSAENTTQLDTQVSRTITYERDPTPGASWYHKGTGIGSDEGPGDDGEYDWEHIDNIRTDLLAYTYTEVDQIYDPGATASQVTVALNAGRSIVNYCGHGSTISWGTTGFSNSYINALTNDDMLPFIISVACLNGQFNGYTCFGEAWLRATNGSAPTGAIGCYASSVDQAWYPPMAAQDEVVDLLVADEKRTFGGLCYNGSMLMMDEYGASGENTFLTWHIFGDPSLRVRTDTPVALTVLHDEYLHPEATSFTVTVTGVEGALCTISYEGEYHGSALTNASGVAEIPIVGVLPEEGDATLTVTAYNTIPALVTLPIFGEGPDKPTGLAAVAGDAQVELSWNPNSEPNLDYYVVYRDTAPSPTDSLAAVAAPTTTYLDLVVENDSTYYYRIKAVDTEGNASPYSDQVSAMPHAPPVVFITHTPLTDTTDPSQAYPVVATITTAGAPLDPDSILVMWQSGTREYSSVVMVPTGTPNEYQGDIPAQTCGTIVDYYILAVDTNGGRETHPDLAPLNVHTFNVSFTVVFTDDFELDRGWTVGAPNDSATTGIWERCDPEGTLAQPEDDHTPSPGVNAYITQCPAGSGLGSYDVDGGRTTLFSPVFDLSAYSSANVQYYRWYSNDTGSNPNEDTWVVEVSSDAGASWTTLENTNLSDASWSMRQFALTDYVALTDQMQFRFIAADLGLGSLVEAGVDDFQITACPLAGDIEPPEVTVVAPNGGEQIIAGEAYDIIWTASDNVAVVTTVILLSTDGGASYPDTLAAGSLDSPWSWDVPDMWCPTCRVRVVCLDAEMNAGHDASDADFAVVRGTGADVLAAAPKELVLSGNRPNPFGGATEIRFGLPAPQRIALRIYNVQGRLVKTLAEGRYPAGYHTITWQGRDGNDTPVATGVYFYRLETDTKVLTQKMIRLK